MMLTNNNKACSCNHLKNIQNDIFKFVNVLIFAAEEIFCACVKRFVHINIFTMTQN